MGNCQPWRFLSRTRASNSGAPIHQIIERSSSLNEGQEDTALVEQTRATPIQPFEDSHELIKVMDDVAMSAGLANPNEAERASGEDQKTGQLEAPGQPLPTQTSDVDAEPPSSIAPLRVIDDQTPEAQRDQVVRRSKEERRKARTLLRAQHGDHRPDVLPSPEFTLCSYTDDKELEQIHVPLQVKYTSSKRVLEDALADKPCSAFQDLDGLLRQLNRTLGTTYTLDELETSENVCGLRDILQYCIDNSYDFGTAYGLLRPRWYRDKFANMVKLFKGLEASDKEMRASSIDRVKGQIIGVHLPPRRVWDLVSNRVIPQWIVGTKDPWAISHSWMETELQQSVYTPVNGREWPVPIPRDTTLARIRVELLNLGAEYVWLDVLCLRQKKEGDPEKEALRVEEWRLDVPTIGNVYHQGAVIVHYFSGLGRPFQVGDLDSDRHWLNRAWTLQEISMNSVKGGIASYSEGVANPKVDENGEYIDPDVGRFYIAYNKLYVIAQEVENVFPVLSAMRRRAATNELDKIAGLAYLLRCKPLPQYDVTLTPNQAFSKLLEVTNERYRGDLFFRFPYPGTDADSGRKWAPSWDQVLAASESGLPETKGLYLFEPIRFEPDKGYLYHGLCVEGVSVKGFSTKGTVSNERRVGMGDRTGQ
ncbi:hypothetical protein CC2G_013795 [Coprinopsis cinerea AmutBmut pab1-1]|nr:hypothetical protein CC2G_013795 [Coprinopsis cinerea AmutBmut pab1-1]